MNNKYINGSFNLHQKFFFIIFLSLIIIVLYFFSIKFIEKKKYINMHDNNIEFLIHNKEYELEKIKNFIQKNKNINGNLTILKLVKLYIQNNKLNEAKKILEISRKYSIDSNIFNLYSLKIAQIQFQNGSLKKSINIINSIQDDSWDYIKNNFKGDIYFKLNKVEHALHLWKKNITQKNFFDFNKIIEMKINYLMKFSHNFNLKNNKRR